LQAQRGGRVIDAHTRPAHEQAHDLQLRRGQDPPRVALGTDRARRSGSANVAAASRPPGLSTRAASPNAVSGSSANWNPLRNEGTALHLAMKALVVEPEDDGYTPYSLSEAGGLERALANAGRDVTGIGEVSLTWAVPGTETTLRALLASAGGARATRAVGEPRVRAALTEAIEPFQDAAGAVAHMKAIRDFLARRP
jgi:hypothetical protein